MVPFSFSDKMAAEGDTVFLSGFTPERCPEYSGPVRERHDHNLCAYLTQTFQWMRKCTASAPRIELVNAELENNCIISY